jgi:hypothetical protein
MADAYVVASDGESQSINDDPLSDRLHRLSLAPPQSLPRELWTEVLRHTAASFAVDWVCAMAYEVLDPHGGGDWWDRIRGIVDVRLRYEFKLERRRPTGPRLLRARFTRCVCPLFKTTNEEWLNLTVARQTAIEDRFARSAIIAPFLELRVELPDAGAARFVFVRRLDPRNQPSLIELSPGWSLIGRRRLLSVSDQLNDKFHMPLRDQNGQLIQERACFRSHAY